jgi:hypothetical protein
MSAPKRAQEDPVKRSDEETQDEIEQIMSEIEQLQKEIGQADAGPMPAPAARKAADRPKPALVKTETGDGPMIESGFTDTDPLEEFRAEARANGEPSLEDTIGDLKGEESTGGALGSGHDSDHDSDHDSEPEVTALSDDEPPETSSETREAIARASREVEEAFEDESDESLENIEQEHAMRDHDDAGKGGDGALTMTLRGNMTLRLQYEIEGQTVTIGFADHALKVQLADGTEFKIPMRNRAPVRRTA